MPAAFKQSVLFAAQTSDASTFRAVLSRVASAPFVPGYAGANLAEKRAYELDRECEAMQAQSHLHYREDYLCLFGTKPVKFEAELSIGSRSVNDFDVELRKPFRNDSPKQLWRRTDDLARALPLVLAWYQPVWSTDEADGLTEHELNEANWHGRTAPLLLRDQGLSGVSASTWFGNVLIERIGRDLLSSMGATQIDNGVMRLDLVAEPWTLGPRQMLTLQRNAMARLEGTGMFAEADFSVSLNEVVKTRKPGSRWSPPPWRMLRADFP